MRKTKGCLLLMVAIAGVCAIVSFSPKSIIASADEGTHVGDWDSFKSAVKKAGKGATIVLDADVQSGGGGSDRIVIDGKEITIDLNGHTVDRNRTSSSSDGHVFEVKGDSKVTITSTGSTRAIVKGGYAKNGGAVNIHDGSTATLSNIEFAGNKASSDGGTIFSRGYFNMDNCIIHDSMADDTGGAIYADDDAWFDINNSTITQNSAKNDGGAFNLHLDKNSTIRNSTISGNKSNSLEISSNKS